MPTVRFPRNPGGRLAATARATLALPALALAALALAAGCGDDSDVVIVALTRTPTPEATAEAAPRTPPSPTASTATPVVAPSSALPPPPQSLLAGANALAPYLAGGAADLEGCVPEVVAAWGFAEIEGPRCVLADLDGDGGDEFALVVTLPRQGETRPGDVWVFADVRRDARLQASARALANAVLGDVSIVAADDLTGDGLPEIVVSSRTCGAAICSTDFLIISAHRGVLEDLAPEDIEVAALDSAVVEDVTGDGRPDLVLRGGVIASAGAGPPRAFRRSLAWSGLRFFVDEQPGAAALPLPRHRGRRRAVRVRRLRGRPRRLRAGRRGHHARGLEGGERLPARAPGARAVRPAARRAGGAAAG